ncbi:MAG: hypothetical protein ACXACX_09220 [Candidatus Hodarchaeales archaeon]|jgi:hypothetical protein
MAGALTQSESNNYYRRLVNVALQLQDVFEEIQRLRSANTTFDFNTNLDEEGTGTLSKAEFMAMITGPLSDFDDWYGNVTVASDGTEGSSDRRDKLNPFIAADPLI